MPLKLNISENGKAWRMEVEFDALLGKSVSDVIDGKDLSADLEGYEFKITGGSDHAGFPMSESVEGIGLKRVLLRKGFGMKDSKPGVRRRKTIRGKTISEDTIQVNMRVVKTGSKKLPEIFPDQNVVKVEEAAKEENPTEVKTETPAEPVAAAA